MAAVFRCATIFCLGVFAAGCSLSTGTARPQPLLLEFSAAQAGKMPSNFSTALTGGGGPPAWVVRTDATASGGAALVQESKDETSYRFPLIIYDKLIAADVSATVQFKAIQGNVDQAAGIVLRYAPENYYVARANALEDNINLFKTVNGKRLKLAEIEKKVLPGQWHSLGFRATGSHLIVTFDGTVAIEIDDATFARPGKVGLWTKADSVTAFAGLRIEAKDRP